MLSLLVHPITRRLPGRFRHFVLQLRALTVWRTKIPSLRSSCCARSVLGGTVSDTDWLSLVMTDVGALYHEHI